ncbi:hypothetical protein [Microcella humidisoli]|uniref:Uncharacterized protein n=1 Tax=Microcella humidisoli TaxID=2963406 RepID=A0ABY5FU63_9MICO|nr:hypothetical protein [Microcella humidisoli]UTT61842.1 hypothetical protein NNL39_09160 [Microcella humidisoli]
MSSEKRGWRSPLLVAGLAVLVFGGLASLFLIAPPGSRVYESRFSIALLVASVGVVVVVVAVWLLRPGSWYLGRLAALDQELSRLVGEPVQLFVGTTSFDGLDVAPEIATIRNGRRSIWRCAVGPRGVAIGRPGNVPRCVVVSDVSDEVTVEVGGPGGGPLAWRNEVTPQLLMRIVRPSGTLTITWDRLVSPSRGKSVRDVNEVAELVTQLTAVLGARSAEPPA